ncbi:FAD-dependent oxidoreductase [Halovenus marina]|uniref:FAD-dependent oxidoreductase n=1 Tax=Halovenus marina TaxID=3396621 RepID=UPI003F560C7A
MTVDSIETDIVVAGAGMAGLSAGVQAVERGNDVVVLEKGERAGGSMRISAGLIWSYETLAEAQENVPKGNPALQQLVVENLDDGFEWIESLGVEVKEPPVELPTGDVVTAPTPGANCGKVDSDELTLQMVEEIENAGGDVLLETPMTDLRTDEANRVIGVDTRGPDGPIQITADAVILATGGFHGNEELLQRHVTPHVENLWIRSNPWSTGDGLEAARDVGARTTGGMHTFYGHNLAAPPAEVTPDTFLDLTQYYGPFAVAIDRDGERYTDESESDLEHTLAQDTALEAGGRAYYVVDGDLYEDEVFSMGRVGTIIERSEEAGAEVLRAKTLDGLGEELTAAGADGSTAVETIREYNEAVRDGRADLLNPPRREHASPLDSPPFCAVAVQPGITFTMGGIAVDERLRVLDRADSSSSLFEYDDYAEEGRTRPVPGLYAAGVDIGGVNNRHYMGGLAQALVTGRHAVDVIAEK